MHFISQHLSPFGQPLFCSPQGLIRDTQESNAKRSLAYKNAYFWHITDLDWDFMGKLFKLTNVWPNEKVPPVCQIAFLQCVR